MDLFALSHKQQEELGYSFLEFIKIINKMSSKFQSSLQSSFCKNHPQIPSGYFIADQPWMKYCKNCALNVALCGRKIEKQLNQTEFDRKMQISRIVSVMKESLEMMEQNSQCYKKLANMLEQMSAPMINHINEIQNALSQLGKVKDKLQMIYKEEIVDKINHYFEKQSKLATLSLEVKRQLQNIESTFGNLIEMEDNNLFSEQKDKWNLVLNNYTKQLISSQQYDESRENINTSEQQFYNHLDWISRFSFDLKLQKNNQKVHTNSQFDITLTPIQGNSLNQTINLENLKLNLKHKGNLKLKSNKKTATQRDSMHSSKMMSNTKRKSFYGCQNHLESYYKKGAV